jgi:hypothetical protein
LEGGISRLKEQSASGYVCEHGNGFAAPPASARSSIFLDEAGSARRFERFA